MAHQVPSTTLLIKSCPDTLLDVVVLAIEEFGFSKSILAAPPNVTLDQAPQQTTNAQSSHVIYMKACHGVGAEARLRSFVEEELNMQHDCAMYCIEVKQRNYPVHFTLLLSHVKGAPPRAAIQELFETFGKCNVRTKDNTMTYINFLRYDHVVNVLEARNQAKLVLNDMVVLVDELVPVQNAKLMLSLETLLKERRAAIIQSQCITKHNLCTWFNAAKKNESCDKTWEQLVDFVSNCILLKFGWTYNSEQELFRLEPKHRMTPSALADKTVVPKRPCAAATVVGTKIATQDAPGTTVATVGPCRAILHEPAQYSDDTGALATTHMEERRDGVGAPEAETDGDVDNNVTSGVLDKTNYIPLYGEESHPLHHRLCYYEGLLFGCKEESNTCMHYRLTNMELMLNIHSDMHPLSVRLTQLDYWTQQYLEVMATAPIVRSDAA